MKENFHSVKMVNIKNKTTFQEIIIHAKFTSRLLSRILIVNQKPGFSFNLWTELSGKTTTTTRQI